MDTIRISSSSTEKHAIREYGFIHLKIQLSTLLKFYVQNLKPVFKGQLVGDDMIFSLEFPGAGISTQNERCENPNRVYEQMIRCMLYSVDISPVY